MLIKLSEEYTIEDRGKFLMIYLTRPAALHTHDQYDSFLAAWYNRSDGSFTLNPGHETPRFIITAFKLYCLRDKIKV